MGKQGRRLRAFALFWQFWRICLLNELYTIFIPPGGTSTQPFQTRLIFLLVAGSSWFFDYPLFWTKNLGGAVQPLTEALKVTRLLTSGLPWRDTWRQPSRVQARVTLTHRNSPGPCLLLVWVSPPTAEMTVVTVPAGFCSPSEWFNMYIPPTPWKGGSAVGCLFPWKVRCLKS